MRVVLGVLVCLVLQAVFYGWGLNQFLTKPHIRHAAPAADGISARERFEKAAPWCHVEDKGTGTVKKLFVDDVDSSGSCCWLTPVPEGIANLMIPLAVYVAMFLCGLETGASVAGLHPDQPALPW